MIEKGYQHRDISIGNVLWHKSAQQKDPVQDTLKEDGSASQYRKNLAALVEQCEITELCNGIVIDGDMAIELKSYFDGTKHRGSRSVHTSFPSIVLRKLKIFQGTYQFMSARLREPLPSVDVEHLQSPVDDLWSFYYVAQWAAAFNCNQFPRKEDIPSALMTLRNDLNGCVKARGYATGCILHPDSLDLTENDCGEFLSNSRSMIIDWRKKLIALENDYAKKFAKPDKKKLEENPYEVYHPLFQEFTDRGVFEYLELVKKFPKAQLAGNAVKVCTGIVVLYFLTLVCLFF